MEKARFSKQSLSLIITIKSSLWWWVCLRPLPCDDFLTRSQKYFGEDIHPGPWVCLELFPGRKREKRKQLLLQKIVPYFFGNLLAKYERITERAVPKLWKWSAIGFPHIHPVPENPTIFWKYCIMFLEESSGHNRRSTLNDIVPIMIQYLQDRFLQTFFVWPEKKNNFLRFTAHYILVILDIYYL